MTTLKTIHGFVATGELEGFDEGSSLLSFRFKGGVVIEVNHPTPQMVQSLTSLGLVRLAHAEVNFQTGKIILGPVPKKDKRPRLDANMVTVPLGPSR